MTMDKHYKKIIIVTDGFAHSHAAEQTVLNLAKRHAASVLIIDTVRPPSFASKWLTSNSEDLFDIVVNDKKERLKKVAAVFEASGIDVNVDVLYGQSATEIARMAVAENADLVVRYRKGEKSRQRGTFGTTARNLMRVCPCPLLLVGDQPIDDPVVLACINVEHSNQENEAILGEAKTLAGSSQKLNALFCWKFYGAEALGEYVNEKAIAGYLDEAKQYYQSAYNRFIRHHDVSAFDQGLRIENGDPTQVIPDTCRNESVDVVVMSSASQNHPLHRLLGSTVESMLDELPCSLLVVKPQEFDSPVNQLDESGLPKP